MNFEPLYNMAIFFIYASHQINRNIAYINIFRRPLSRDNLLGKVYKIYIDVFIYFNLFIF